MNYSNFQHEIKSQTEQIQNFVGDLNDWEKIMRRKESMMLQEPLVYDNEMPPVRAKISKMDNVLESDYKNVNLDQKYQRQKREESLFQKEKGNESVRNKKWQEAIQHYTHAIECFSKDATFYANRAYCFLQLQQWKSAETDCCTALQLDPTYVKAYHRRALALMNLNQLKEARADMLKALELDSNNSCIANELSKINKLMEKENNHIENNCTLNSKTEESCQNSAFLKKNEGNEYVKKKDWKSAIKCYTEACGLYSKEPSFYLNRSFCYLKVKEPEKAILDCIRVLEMDPNNIKAYYRRALAYQILNDDESAFRDLSIANQLDSSNKTIKAELDNLKTKLSINNKTDDSTKNQTNEVNCEEKNHSQESESNDCSNEQLTSDCFAGLELHPIKPVIKSPHMRSKQPMEKIHIEDASDENTAFKAHLEEIKLKTVSTKETKQNDHNTITLSASQENIEDSSNFSCISLTEEDVDPPPKTLMQFTNAWNKLLPYPHLQYCYLKQIDGSQFPSLFKYGLECDIFSQILEILSTKFIDDNESVYSYLNGLSNVSRFNALLLFATPDDTKNIKTLISHCEKLNDASSEQLSVLRSRFYC